MAFWASCKNYIIKTTRNVSSLLLNQSISDYSRFLVMRESMFSRNVINLKLYASHKNKLLIEFGGFQNL